MQASVAERFRGGEPGAVREVFRRYGRLVFSVALSRLGNRELAEDVTQETFVRAWKASARFDANRDLAPWLCTIARRVAVDFHRRESRRSHVRVDDLRVDHPTIVSLPPDIGDWYRTWEVHAAVAELPAVEAEVVVLHHLHGLTHSQIATRTGIPIGTVKSRMNRAHRYLAARLGHLRGETP